MREKIFGIIESITGVNLPEPPYDMELEVVGIDSIAFIQIIIDIEEQCYIEFDDEALYYGNYASLQDFLDFVEKRLNKNIVQSKAEKGWKI